MGIEQQTGSAQTGQCTKHTVIYFEEGKKNAGGWSIKHTGIAIKLGL